MGYRIEYDNRVGKYEIHRMRPRTFPWLLLLSVLLFALLTFGFWEEGAAVLSEALIPGDEEITQRAWSLLTDDLKSGAELREALTVFCREVIHGADPG